MSGLVSVYVAVNVSSELGIQAYSRASRYPTATHLER